MRITTPPPKSARIEPSPPVEADLRAERSTEAGTTAVALDPFPGELPVTARLETPPDTDPRCEDPLLELEG
jgi:hypothetical protein